MSSTSHIVGSVSSDPAQVRFRAWAKQQGIKINGVKAVQIPERGVGIVAQRKIEPGEKLVYVPRSAFLTPISVPKDFRCLHHGISAQGLLASFLAFGGVGQSCLQPWIQTWPCLNDLKASLPFLWSSELRNFSSQCENSSLSRIPAPISLYPPAIECHSSNSTCLGDESTGLCLLQKQKRKFQRDWQIVSKTFSTGKPDIYAYFWLLVNTRSFYYDHQQNLGGRAMPDHLVLCPFIDYFNHNGRGCDVHFDRTGYTVHSDREYNPGEELFVTYGNHSNDFLLVEYGFILSRNQWDWLPIDHLIHESGITLHSNKALEESGYLWDYNLTRDGVCHRTHVAVRSHIMPYPAWQQFIAGTLEPDPADENRADCFIAQKILDRHDIDAERTINHLRNLPIDLATSTHKILIARWTQIRELIRDVFATSVNPCTGQRLAAFSERYPERRPTSSHHVTGD